MKTILIILSIVGLLKLVSIFVCFILQIYNKIKGTPIMEFHRNSSFYIDSAFCIIPTIEISTSVGYFEITFHLFNMLYYEAIKIEYE